MTCLAGRSRSTLSQGAVARRSTCQARDRRLAGPARHAADRASGGPFRRPLRRWDRPRFLLCRGPVLHLCPGAGGAVGMRDGAWRWWRCPVIWVEVVPVGQSDGAGGRRLPSPARRSVGFWPVERGGGRSGFDPSSEADGRRSTYSARRLVAVCPFRRGQAVGFCPFWRGGGQGWTCRSGGQPLPCPGRRSAAREVGPSRRSESRQDEPRGFRRAGVLRFRPPWFRLWPFGPCCSRGGPRCQTGSCCATGRARRGPSTSPSLPATCRVGSRPAGRVSGRLDADPRCRPAHGTRVGTGRRRCRLRRGAQAAM